MGIVDRILKNRLFPQVLALFAILSVVLFILINTFISDLIVERHGTSAPLFFAKLAFISAVGAGLVSLSFAAIAGRRFLKPYTDGFKRFLPLIKLMVERDYKSRYKRNVLGVLWSLLSPLMTMVIMTIVFSYLFRFEIPNFPVYILSGLLMFNYFSEATNIAMISIQANRGIITKVYVPKYIFPMTKVFSSFVNLLFSLIALFAVILLTQAPLQWTLLLIPVPIAYLTVFVLGVSLLLSCAAVFFKDMQYLYGVFTTALMYFTPIIYPISILPERVLTFMGLNPMFHFVSYFRNLVLNGEIPDVWSNVVCISFSLFFLFVGTLVFMSKQDKYILHI